jgi:hypothetical protein
MAGRFCYVGRCRLPRRSGCEAQIAIDFTGRSVAGGSVAILACFVIAMTSVVCERVSLCHRAKSAAALLGHFSMFLALCWPP